MVEQIIPLDGLTSGGVEAIEVYGQAGIVIEADDLFTAEFHRAGDDLLLHAADGKDILLRDYFAADHPPQLETPEGARLSADTVEALAGPKYPHAYAQAGDPQPSQPIGEVSTLNGLARVQHADGTRADLHDGDPIFQGDVVSTGVGSELGIHFVDDTAFSLSANARMVIDELVYNPSGSANSMGVSLVQGTFVFVTGAIAPTGGIEVDTPSGTIGIRGTTVGVQIATFGGGTRIVNLVNLETGEHGSFVFTNFGGSAQFTQAYNFLEIRSANDVPGVPSLATNEFVTTTFGRDLNNVIRIQHEEPPTNLNSGDQQGNLQPNLPKELIESLLNLPPIETAAGGDQALSGGSSFIEAPWLGQLFSFGSITPQGVIGEVTSLQFAFPESFTFSVIFTPPVPGIVSPQALFGLPGATGGGAGIIASIKEDSDDNQAIFAAQAGGPQNELTSISIALPGFAPGDIDISQIIADLAGPPPLGTVTMTASGGVTTILITFVDAQNVQTFGSSFTLDAPLSGSDIDLPGISITANAALIADHSVTGTASAAGTLVLDAVLDEYAVVTPSELPDLQESQVTQELPLNLSLSFVDAGFDSSGPDSDASEAITAVTVFLSAGSLALGAGAPAGAFVTDDGGGNFTLQVADPADYGDAIAALKLVIPAGVDGTVTGTISVTTAEVAPNGEEIDGADNSRTDIQHFSTTITGGTVSPTISFGGSEGGEGGGDYGQFGDSGTLSQFSALGAPITLAAESDLVHILTIQEDSQNNVIQFSVGAGDATDELTALTFELPGIPPEAIDIAQILADLPGTLSSAEITTPGGVTTITIIFDQSLDVQSFSSTFTLDAPLADSDVDLSGIKVTAYAKDITDDSATGSASVDGIIVVDAVADGGAQLVSGGYAGSVNGSVVDLDLTLDPHGGNAANPLGDLFNGGGFDDDGSEAVAQIEVTLTGSPVLTGEGDALLLFDAGFGGAVTHEADSLVWTFTGTQAQLQSLAGSLQIDPSDEYSGTVSVGIVVTTAEAASVGGDNGAHGLEDNDSDNVVNEAFTFDVDVAIDLGRQVVINEIGLGVGTSLQQNVSESDATQGGQNYIEILNVTDSTISAAKVGLLSVDIMGGNGTIVTVDLATATGGSIALPPHGFLTIFEDGTWATSTAGGAIQQTGTYTVPGSYSGPASVWGFGSDTSAETGVNVKQGDASIDLFVANGAAFSGAAGGWIGAGIGTPNAAALLGSLVNLETFSGVTGDQDALLAALGRSDIAIHSGAVTGDEVTRVFSRIFSGESSDESGQDGGSPIDSDQARDWTTSNAPTPFSFNDDDHPAPGVNDLNPQDPSDDLNPAQGAGTNGADAGQTVLHAESDGDTLEGGRGQDFLFGDADDNLLLGGDHNDFLFGDRGNDSLEGGKGADLLVDIDGQDVLIGGSGDDILIGSRHHADGGESGVPVTDPSGDLLVGDEIVSGAVPTFNVVYAIDISESMARALDGTVNAPAGQSRLDYARAAFLDLNQQIIDAGLAGVVNIKVVPFNHLAFDSASPAFDSADDPALNAFIAALAATGDTQYEAPLQIAADWLLQDGRYLESENFIFFLSDGVDNNGYNPSTGLRAALYGVDGAAPLISNLTIEAFGLGTPGASNFKLGELGHVETGANGHGDQVTVVDGTQDIDQIFSAISLTDQTFGEDVILGCDGNDYIFGDTLLVDPDFVGSARDYVEQVLFDDGPEAVGLRTAIGTFGKADWIEGGAGNDSILAQGGDDRVIGGSGADYIDGGSGNDTLEGGLDDDFIWDGSGEDLIYGGGGADTIFLTGDGQSDRVFILASDEVNDTINGFDVGAPGSGGDVLDLSALLHEGSFAGTTLAEAQSQGYIALTADGGNATVLVDLDGAAGATHSPTVAVTLNGIDLTANPAALDDNIVVS